MKIHYDSFKKFITKNKTTVLLCVFLFGIMLISIPVSQTSKSDNIQTNVKTAEEYKESLEAQIENILSQVTGIGEIDVMITLERELSESVLFNESISESISTNQNERNTTQLNSTKEVVMIKDSQGTTPYTISNDYPSVTGVIVVATGADDPIIKSYIIQAVKAALEVQAHKIVVLPKGD